MPGFIMTTTKTRQALIGCLVAFLFGFASAQPLATPSTAPTPSVVDEDITQIKPPPRNIQDILRVLEQSQPDPNQLERAKAIVALAEPPAGSDVTTMYNYFYKRSRAQQKLGQIDDSIADMRRAVRDFPYPDPRIATQGLVNLAVVENFGGYTDNAIELLRRAKSNYERAKAAGALFTVNRLLVITLVNAGNFEAARTIVLESDALLVSQRNNPRIGELLPFWESNIESGRGFYLRSQGQWVEAERALRKTLRLLLAGYEKVRGSPKRVDDLAEGSDAASSQGAVNPLNYATQISSRYRDLSDVLVQQRKLIDAEYYARLGLTMSLENFGRSSTDVGNALASLSRVVSEQGRFPEAVLLSQASLRAQSESGITDESRVMALSRKFYATALVADGQYVRADEVFRQMMESVAKNPVLLKSFPSRDLDWVMAMQKMGKHEESQAMAQQMRAAAEKQFGKGAPRTALIAAFEATSLQGMGRQKESLALFREATPVLVDQTRSDAENNTATLKQQLRTTYLFESYLSQLARLAASEPGEARAAAVEAFRIADLAKNSGVQRALTASAARANIKDPQLAQIARKEQDLQRRVTSLSELLTALQSAPPDQQLPAIQAKLRTDIDAFKNEREALKKDIEKRFPDYAEMMEPKPATVERTQRLLRADEVLVSWYFAEKEAYVWAISRQGVPLFKSVPMGRSEMARQVGHLRKALDAGVSTIDEIPEFDLMAAHKLYQQILAPVAEGLKDKKVLLVVPHAELGQLPLSVLVTREPVPSPSDVKFGNYRASPWLGRDIAIAQLPSVTALTALRNTPAPNPNRKAFIGFGDPFFSLDQQKSADRVAQRVAGTQMATRGLPLQLRSAPQTSSVSSAELGLLPRLPDTQDEINEIAKVLSAAPGDVFLNRLASVKSVMEADLSNRKVVMFATHGLVPGELDGLTQPALAMSSPDVTGDKDDGLLTMDKVMSLKLDADWVVLSACNTASGEGAGSEAISGLGRAFFYAGARALLVSNWPVDSVAARELMTDLFKRQQTGNASMAKPEALRQAMMELVDRGGMKAAGAMKYSYAHPLFWAPFVVVGD
jgi:CHAT domain-containing protein